MATSEVSSTERRRVPAGNAIAVVLLSLVMCAVLDADAMMASIEQQPFGTSRTVGLALARPVRAISHWTGLDLPRKWLDELLNGSPARVRVPSVPIAIPAPTTIPPSEPAHGGVAPSPLLPQAVTPAPAPAPVVGRRVPTAAQPLRVWMAGDSLMGSVSESFAALTKSRHDVTVTNSVQIGTGLARPDVYDWPAAVSQEMTSANPDVVVFLFGANDDQNLQVGDHFALRGTDAWRQEYTRRVSQLMALASTGNRQVIWVGVPAVKRPRLNQTKDVMNQAAQAAAALYSGVSYIDTGAILDGPGATYVTYLTGAGGQPVRVRESDGIHLTLAGANRVTPLIFGPIKQLWGLKP